MTEEHFKEITKPIADIVNNIKDANFNYLGLCFDGENHAIMAKGDGYKLSQAFLFTLNAESDMCDAIKRIILTAVVNLLATNDDARGEFMKVLYEVVAKEKKGISND